MDGLLGNGPSMRFVYKRDSAKNRSEAGRNARDDELPEAQKVFSIVKTTKTEANQPHPAALRNNNTR